MSASKLSNTQARDMASLLHPFVNLTVLRQTGPLVVERGKGVFVYGADGRDYLEAMGGLWCTALGWGEEELVQAAAEQMRKLSFSHIFGGKSHEPAIALAEKLKEMAPFPVGKVFFANSGSEANDSQIKLMWYAANARGQKGRKKIIARNKAYHGVTLASASLTGLDASTKASTCRSTSRCGCRRRIIIAAAATARRKSNIPSAWPMNWTRASSRKVPTPSPPCSWRR
jgi:4-aminobutyrate--pyruvate transaminase